jgi:hypothetical protein
VSIYYSVSGNQNVTLQVTDVAGRLVQNLVLDEKQIAGTHKYLFTGNAAGVYLVHLFVDEKLTTKKIVKTAD